MNVEKANALADKRKEPKKMSSVLKYIKGHSKLGYKNCSVQFENNPEAIAGKLRKLGFKIFIEEWNVTEFLLHIEW